MGSGNKIINQGDIITTRRIQGLDIPSDEPPSVGVGLIPGLWQDNKVWDDSKIWSDTSGALEP